MRIYRLWNGKKYPAQPEGGFFVLANPALGNRKHIAANAVRVRTEAEAIDLLRKGYSIRVVPEKGTRGTLVRRNLHIDGVLLT